MDARKGKETLDLGEAKGREGESKGEVMEGRWIIS